MLRLGRPQQAQPVADAAGIVPPLPVLEVSHGAPHDTHSRCRIIGTTSRLYGREPRSLIPRKGNLSLFQVKICGITRVEDALLAAEAGADAIGLNFFEGSPRFVDFETALLIAQSVRSRSGNRPKLVGVFVNSDPAKIFQAMELLQLDGVQFHGDEPPSAVAALSGMSNLFALAGTAEGRTALEVIRAFRCKDEGLAPVSEYLCQCDAARPNASEGLATLPHAVLLDAYSSGAYGGTGKVVDWEAVRRDRDLLLGLPVILAGGLTPENVAEAIAAARPDGVDTASGVEDSPGRKNEVKVRSFVSAAKDAFERAKLLR